MAFLGLCNIFVEKNKVMDKIIGLGNVLVDISVTLKNDDLLRRLALPKGSMQLIDTEKATQIRNKFRDMPTRLTTGGSAGNTMLALGHLGEQPALIGCLGADDDGRFYRDTFRRYGVSDACLNICPANHTGTAYTLISPDGQRTFGTYLGASATIGPDNVSPDVLRPYAYLYIEGYMVQNPALLRRAVSLARELGLKVCIDMASYNVVDANRELFLEILPQTEIVFANEDESRTLARTADERVALDYLATLTRVAVVKVGARGAWVRRGNEVVQVPAMDVPRVVDTNTAGDFFAAGFLYNYVRGASLTACAQSGTLLAGHVIQVTGSAIPEPVWHEIKLNIQTI